MYLDEESYSDAFVKGIDTCESLLEEYLPVYEYGNTQHGRDMLQRVAIHNAKDLNERGDELDRTAPGSAKWSRLRREMKTRVNNLRRANEHIHQKTYRYGSADPKHYPGGANGSGMSYYHLYGRPDERKEGPIGWDAQHHY